MLYVLIRSPFGKSLLGIRERELRMRILGYNVWLHKYIAFIIAGAFGGLSGVLWAHANGIVTPETVVLTTSVDALLMNVLGGAGTLVGGAIGKKRSRFIRRRNDADKIERQTTENFVVAGKLGRPVELPLRQRRVNPKSVRRRIPNALLP